MKLKLLNRTLAEGIQEGGFRRWYQRELLSGHAHLVLLVLSTVATIGCLEVMGSLDRFERLLNSVYIVLCVGIGIWALRRYVHLLMRAEAIAHQANCPQCGRYGLLAVVNEDRPHQRLRVRCRKCEAHWHIEE